MSYDTQLSFHLTVENITSNIIINNTIYSNTKLGPDPFHTSISIRTQEVLPDRTLQEVVNKIFPYLKEKEDEDERKFYEQRGIELKPEYAHDTNNIDNSIGRRVVAAHHHGGNNHHADIVSDHSVFSCTVCISFDGVGNVKGIPLILTCCKSLDDM